MVYSVLHNYLAHTRLLLQRRANKKNPFPYKKPRLTFLPTRDPSIPALCWHLLGNNLIAPVLQPRWNGTTYVCLLTRHECGGTRFGDCCFCQFSVYRLQSVECLTRCLICCGCFPSRSHVICNNKLKHSYFKNIQRGPGIWKGSIVLYTVFLDIYPAFLASAEGTEPCKAAERLVPLKRRGGY